MVETHCEIWSDSLIEVQPDPSMAWRALDKAPGDLGVYRNCFWLGAQSLILASIIAPYWIRRVRAQEVHLDNDFGQLH